VICGCVVNAVRRSVPTEATVIATFAAGIVVVAANTAVTTPELAELVAEVAPATVKKLAPTPVST